MSQNVMTHEQQMQSEEVAAADKKAKELDASLRSLWQCMSRWSIRICRVRGVDIRIHALAFPLILIKFSFIKLLIVMLTLLIHEAGHAIMALDLKRAIKGIVLIPPIGAITIGDINPQEDYNESSMIASAGPLANLVAGLCLWAVCKVCGLTQGSELYKFLNTLGFLNLIVGIANLIPIWPLDGGRMMYSEIAARNIPDKTVKVITFWVSVIFFIAASWWCYAHKSYWSLGTLAILIVVAYCVLMKNEQRTEGDASHAALS